MLKIILSFLILFFEASFSFAGITIMGELAQEKTLDIGEKFEGTIVLKNTGRTACQVNVYKTDYIFYADGTNVYGEAGTAPRSNASWLSVSPSRLTVLPDEIASVYYTVQVPEPQELASVNNDIQVDENAILIGSYWSMVMIELVPEADFENIEDETGRIKIGIQTIIRYGIQIITNIGDSGTRKIEFQNRKLFSQDGKTMLQMDIANIGQKSLAPAVWLEIYDPDGKSLGRFKGDKKWIHPGCSVRQNINLTGVPPGKYQALVVADNGDESVFGAKYDLEFK